MKKICGCKILNCFFDRGLLGSFWPRFYPCIRWNVKCHGELLAYDSNWWVVRSRPRMHGCFSGISSGICINIFLVFTFFSVSQFPNTHKGFYKN